MFNWNTPGGTARWVGQTQADVGRGVLQILGRAQMFPKACVLQRRSFLSEIVGRSWARLSAPRRSWALLGVLGRSLGPWGGLGAVWAPSWDGLGAVLGRSWAVLGRLGRVLSPSWRVWCGLEGAPWQFFSGRVAIGRTVKNDVFLRIFTCLQAPLGVLGTVLRRPGAVLWRRRGVLRLLCGCETVKSDVQLSTIIEDRRGS